MRLLVGPDPPGPRLSFVWPALKRCSGTGECSARADGPVTSLFSNLLGMVAFREETGYAVLLGACTVLSDTICAPGRHLSAVMDG